MYVLQQMKLLHAGGFTKTEKAKFTNVVRDTTLKNAKKLVSGLMDGGEHVASLKVPFVTGHLLHSCS